MRSVQEVANQLADIIIECQKTKICGCIIWNTTTSAEIELRGKLLSAGKDKFTTFEALFAIIGQYYKDKDLPLAICDVIIESTHHLKPYQSTMSSTTATTSLLETPSIEDRQRMAKNIIHTSLESVTLSGHEKASLA